MAASKKNSYLDLAKKYGQDVERLKAGEPVSTYVQVHSIEEFKELFAGGVSKEVRQKISANNAASHKSALASKDPMARLADHVYGTGKVTDEDRKILNHMMPVTVLLVSADDMEVTTDITYGPSAGPVALNVGTLTFNGGSIITENTVLNLMADTVAFGPNPGTKPYHIALNGVNGGDGDDGDPGSAPDPAQAKSGSDAHERSPGVCTGVGDGGDGSDGATGDAGGSGDKGDDGKANLNASINIGAFSSSAPGKLVLYSCSGSGGKGGRGGTGGAGQKGGNGGKGCDSGCEGTEGGDAGNGGKGGKGGNGGVGGNGVNGNDITVIVPAANVKDVMTSTDIAPFGQGGHSGDGGSGGDAGSKGKGGKGSADGKAGTKGDPGDPGDTGDPGTQQGSPGQFYIQQQY